MVIKYLTPCTEVDTRDSCHRNLQQGLREKYYNNSKTRMLVNEACECTQLIFECRMITVLLEHQNQVRVGFSTFRYLSAISVPF